MRVIHVISGGDTGGAKTHVLSLLQELNKHIEADLVCFLGGEFYEEAVASGIHCYLVEQRRRWDLGVLSELRKLLRERQYDVWHAHGARANFITALLKPWLSIPAITTMHSDYRLDFEGNWYKYHVYTTLNALALRFFDKYVAVSDSFKDMLVSRGFNEEDIGVVYNGIDFQRPLDLPDRREALERYGLGQLASRKLVGIVTRFDPVKGVDVFLEGARHVAEQRDDVHFLIVGDGPDRPNVTAAIDRAGLNHRVHLLGYVEGPDALINAFDINTLTSHSESFPYALLEGAHLKRPTVASRVGGIPRLILHGETGLLFEAGDANEFARQLLELLDNPKAAEELGRNLYNHASRTYSVASMAARQLEIYRGLTTPSTPKPSRRIVLSGYYGFENSGDEAILETIIDNLRRPDNQVQITALSGDPANTSVTYGVEAVPRASLPALYRVLSRADLVISGGGSLLQDVTSSRSLWYYLGVIAFAKLLGKPVMVYANGLGPIDSPTNRALTRRVLETVDFITLRDRESMQLLGELGLRNPNVELTADPVFTLAPPPVEARKLMAKEGLPQGFFDGEVVGVCLRPWPGQDKIVEIVADVLDGLRRSGKEIVLFPMQHDRDMAVLRELQRAMNESTVLLEEPYGAREILAITGAFDWIISMRLHTLAALHGLPMIGLIYDPKVESFLEEVGQIGVELGSMTRVELQSAVEQLQAERGTRTEAVRRQARGLQERARRNAELARRILEQQRYSNNSRKEPL